MDSHEMIDKGESAQREMPTVILSRYACYLIVQNPDPAKDIVALGQTYFAAHTEATRCDWLKGIKGKWPGDESIEELMKFFEDRKKLEKPNK